MSSTEIDWSSDEYEEEVLERWIAQKEKKMKREAWCLRELKEKKRRLEKRMKMEIVSGRDYKDYYSLVSGMIQDILVTVTQKAEDRAVARRTSDQ